MQRQGKRIGSVGVSKVVVAQPPEASSMLALESSGTQRSYFPGDSFADVRSRQYSGVGLELALCYGLKIIALMRYDRKSTRRVS